MRERGRTAIPDSISLRAGHRALEKRNYPYLKANIKESATWLCLSTHQHGQKLKYSEIGKSN